MPMIGGTTSWIGPLVGAILLGSAAADRHRHHLLGGQPADRRRAAGRLRHHRAQRHRRAGAGTPARAEAAMTRAAARRQSQQALRRLRRARRHRPRGAAGRAARPDRPERLGQEHAGQLHLRHAAATRPARVRFDGQAIDGLAAHQRTRRGMARSFQLPRPFHSMTLADNLRIPLLYTVHAREGRCARPAISTRAATSCSTWSGSRKRPSRCRAT